MITRNANLLMLLSDTPEGQNKQRKAARKGHQASVAKLFFPCETLSGTPEWICRVVPVRVTLGS